jgi:hypothetical protein
VTIGLVTLSGIAAFGLSASPAFAASPNITATCPTGGSCTVRGSGFTPSGQVLIQTTAGSSLVSSYSVTASDPVEVCQNLLKPVCHEVGGGIFGTVLPTDYGLPCGATAAGTVRATDVSTSLSVTDPVTLMSACAMPTTTSLFLASTVDTGGTAGVNPARVNSGSTPVTAGTVTVTVNGATFCTYTAGATSGCTLANLPAGTDQVRASYSGNASPWFAPSSATASVTVLPVDASVPQNSLNWAGYVDTSDTYTSVSGSWTVPTASCGNLWTGGDVASSSATWVGIDGNSNSDSTVEQIGTDSNCVLYTGEYHAWWEMAPDAANVIDIIGHPVHPGDHMTANVTSTGKPGSFSLTITDTTENWSYNTTASISGAVGGSAEWITEQPSDFGLPLTNFGSVTFTQARATGSNGVATPIWDHPNSVDTMTGGVTKAAASSLSNDGTQFTISWLHN